VRPQLAGVRTCALQTITIHNCTTFLYPAHICTVYHITCITTFPYIPSVMHGVKRNVNYLITINTQNKKIVH